MFSFQYREILDDALVGLESSGTDTHTIISTVAFPGAPRIGSVRLSWGRFLFPSTTNMERTVCF